MAKAESSKTKTKSIPELPPYKNKDLSDLTGEEWKDIPGLEEYAMISSFGRVKRLSYELINNLGRLAVFRERIQAQKITRSFNQFKQDFKQHLSVGIQINNVTHSISVGRLMYHCFVAPFDLKDKSLYVIYKDGDGLNVHPDNLELVDFSGFQQRIMRAERKDLHFGHSEENQEIFSRLGQQVVVKQVSSYDMEGRYLETYESLSEAARKMGISLAAISVAVRKKGLTAAGRIWRFGNSRKAIGVHKILKALRDAKGAPVSRYDLEGRLMATYCNITEAANTLGIDRKTIESAVTGKILVTAGSVWRKGSAERIDVTREKESLSLRKGYTISQYDTHGNKVNTFTNSKDAANAAGVQGECINARAIRNDLLLRGHIWRYGDVPRLAEEELKTIMENLAKPKESDISQYDLKGARVGYYPNMATAAFKTGITINMIRGCVNGHKATGGGFIWRRGKGPLKLILPPTPRPLGCKLIRKITQFDLSGNEIATYPSIAEAAKSLGIHYTTIAAVARGAGRTAGGFVWKKVLPTCDLNNKPKTKSRKDL